MANDEVMQVDKRLARLEETVAKGFYEHGQRLDKIEARLADLPTRDEWSQFAKKSDLTEFATKADLARFATKEDLSEFAGKMEEALARLPTKEDLTRVLTNHEERLVALEKAGGRRRQ